MPRRALKKIEKMFGKPSAHPGYLVPPYATAPHLQHIDFDRSTVLRHDCPIILPSVVSYSSFVCQQCSQPFLSSRRWGLCWSLAHFWSSDIFFHFLINVQQFHNYKSRNICQVRVGNKPREKSLGRKIAGSLNGQC